ncbi:MAG TPA: PD-(D/E)XK nuclease family protein, partial [Natronosporangium sp.]|nr:PD-(D/E)XK nuclease family protein [Natronosporangium sp.]
MTSPPATPLSDPREPAPPAPAAAGASALVEDLPSLSPSRAADFKTCPLLYRFRVIDRLPETPSLEQVRGTLVHAVLEQLFDLPAPDRTRQAAGDLVTPQWRRLRTAQPELAEVVPPEQEQEFLAAVAPLLDGYFRVEDPRRLEPDQRESLIEVVVDQPAAGPVRPRGDTGQRRLKLRGYVDRLDVSPAGDLRVVDYKTGGAPREAFEGRALFQLKFYALALWRSRGVLPSRLQLVYPRDRTALWIDPTEADLLATERKVLALWAAIEQAATTGDWRPRAGRACRWCAHQSVCPTFGGTPPPLPPDAAARA